MFGFISLTRALYPTLRERHGVVVNVIGSAGETFDPGYIAGVAGNAALMAFSRGVGRGASKDGLRVVANQPGAPSPPNAWSACCGTAPKPNSATPSAGATSAPRCPTAARRTPAEIAAAIAFLASPRSAYTNGTVLTINGGP